MRSKLWTKISGLFVFAGVALGCATGAVMNNDMHKVSAEETVSTITFDDTSKRTTYSTEIQTWVENGITVTNEKNVSSNDVADYINPARFYAGSSLEISVTSGNIAKLVFKTTESKYATALVASAGIGSTNSTVATIIPTETSSTFTVATFTAQVRVSYIDVTITTGAVAKVESLALTIDDGYTTEYESTDGDFSRENLTVIATLDDKTTKDVSELSTFEFDKEFAVGTFTLGITATYQTVKSNKATISVTVTKAAASNTSGLEAGTYYIKLNSEYYISGISSGTGKTSTNVADALEFVFTLAGPDLWTIKNNDKYMSIGTSSKSLTLVSTETLLSVSTLGSGYAIKSESGARGLAWYEQGSDVRTYATATEVILEAVGSEPVLPPEPDTPEEPLTCAEAKVVADGQTVTVRGVVAAFYDGKCFLMIDKETSEGLIVYEYNHTLSVGDQVLVTGQLTTYNGLKEVAKGCEITTESTGHVVTPRVVDLETETDLSQHITDYVTVKNMKYNGDVLDTTLDSGITINTEGLVVRSNKYDKAHRAIWNDAFANYKDLTSTVVFDFTGIMGVHSGTPQLLLGSTAVIDVNEYVTFVNYMNETVKDVCGTDPETVTGETWTTAETLFGYLSAEEKATFKALAADQEGTAEQQAAARYDQIVAKRAAKDFAGRDTGATSNRVTSILNNNNNNLVLIIVIASSLVAVAAIAFIYYRKRQLNK